MIGYNGTLGPSKGVAGTIFMFIVNQQKGFFNRYEGGLVGTHLSADHHHNVPGRMHVTDQATGQKFAPVHGIHTVMNEKNQYVSHRWTATTSNDERRAIADDLIKRYHDRNIDTRDIIMYLDKCCDDCAWLSSFPDIRVLLDNHHLITRYRDNSNGTNRAQHEIFMRKIALIISGSSQVKMRPGPQIYSELTAFLAEFEEYEKKEIPSLRVITSRTRECHKTQAKHFQNCITEPENALVTIQDRFHRKTLRRGSGKNENGWRHMRAVFPEMCSLQFGDALMTALIASWNFNREMHYDPRWAYLPISPMHIVLTQHLALLPKDHLSTLNGVSSMFLCLPLALDDFEHSGFTQSFADALPALPSIPQQAQDGVARMAESIADFSIWDSFTMDPLADQAVEIAGATDISSILSSQNTSTSTANEEGAPISPRDDGGGEGASKSSRGDGGGDATVLPHDIASNRKRKQKGPVSHVRSGLTSHKKKAVSMNALGNQRQSALESLQIWDSVMGLSPLFNPLERRVLRFLALHCVELPQKIETLAQFPIKDFHFPTLDRLWGVFIAAIKISDFKFKHYLRPKSLQSLKQQLEDMVVMAKFHLNFSSKSQSRSMVTTLQNSAEKLTEMSQAFIRARKTVTTTLTRTELVEVEIPLPHTADATTTRVENEMVRSPMMTSPQEASGEVPLQKPHEPSEEEFLFSIVEKEQQDNAGKVRWKKSILPQWNSWCAERKLAYNMKAKQLKNRYQYIQRKAQTPIAIDQATIATDEASAIAVPLSIIGPSAFGPSTQVGPSSSEPSRPSASEPSGPSVLGPSRPSASGPSGPSSL